MFLNRRKFVIRKGYIYIQFHYNQTQMFIIIPLNRIYFSLETNIYLYYFDLK